MRAVDDSLALLYQGSRYRTYIWITCVISIITGALFARSHRSRTEDLYPNALHRTFGVVLIIFICIYAIYMVCRPVIFTMHKSDFSCQFGPLARSDDAESSLNLDRQRLQQDTSESDSARSSDTLYRVQRESLERHDSADSLNPEQHPGRFQKGGVHQSRLDVLTNYVGPCAKVLILAAVYVQILLGVSTYCGIFIGHTIFNGLAHWIKASVFFLFGIWVFTRYLGAFADIGHAWNLADTSEHISAESIECGLIFTYGVSNIFLERLGHSSEPISHTDIQHLCIAAMFAFGGFIGLLLESKIIRRVLDSDPLRDATSTAQSLNIMPALVVFFTGLLMSQHHQDTALSSDVHAVWGYYFCTASILRLVTYLLIYLSPPSRKPSRPPTEITVAFCLIAGSLVFMMSARDPVQSLEYYGMDLMFMVSLSVAGSLGVLGWVLYVMVLCGLNRRGGTR